MGAELVQVILKFWLREVVLHPVFADLETRDSELHLHHIKQFRIEWIFVSTTKQYQVSDLFFGLESKINEVNLSPVRFCFWLYHFTVPELRQMEITLFPSFNQQKHCTVSCCWLVIVFRFSISCRLTFVMKARAWVCSNDERCFVWLCFGVSSVSALPCSLQGFVGIPPIGVGF